MKDENGFYNESAFICGRPRGFFQCSGTVGAPLFVEQTLLGVVHQTSSLNQECIAGNDSNAQVIGFLNVSFFSTWIFRTIESNDVP